MSFTQPTTTDIHNQTTYAATSDTQTWAKNFFNDMWAFLQYRGLTGNNVMFGETNPVDNAGCDQWTEAQAAAVVAGYLESSLYTQRNSGVAMRPWHDLRDYCTPSPNTINPPF